MPELPEVETTLRGIESKILNKKIISFVSREKKLRWLIPKNINKLVKGKKINNAFRRGKYIIFQLDECALIIHLGMSGKLRVFNKKISPIVSKEEVLNTMAVSLAIEESLSLGEPKDVVYPLFD